MALTRHFLRIYARLTLGRCSEYLQGRRAVSTPAHALFKLDTSFSSVHSETCFVVVLLIPRFEGSVGITADFPVQWPGAKFLGSSHSSKDWSLKVSSAPAVCHLNCSRAETTTSFKFEVLSAFHSLHSSSCWSSSTLNLKLLSDSQSQASTAFTRLKKTSWSYQKHNNTCQLKISLHLTNCLHLAKQFSFHIFSITIWIFNCFNTIYSHNNSTSPLD